MRKKLLILGVLFAVIPIVALAWNIGDPLVHCGRSGTAPCSLCDIFTLGQNIVDFLTKAIAPALAVLAFAMAGFKILTSGGSPGARQEGIKIIRNTIIGLLIVFGAWIIINELLVFFAGSLYKTGGAMPWSKITCVAPVTKAPTVTVPGPAYDPIGTPNGAVREYLAATAQIYAKTNYCSDFGVPYKTGDACCTTLAQLPDAARDGLIALKKACKCPISITGGTETICHSSHGPGKSIVDVQLNDTLRDWIFMGAVNAGVVGTDASPRGFPAGSKSYNFGGVDYIYEFNKSGLPTHWHIIF